MLDALRDAPHPTHMTIDQAVEAASEIRPAQTWLTHLCHEISHARREALLPAGVRIAHDGLTLSVEEG